jgi:23S rRNA (adenine1618-N6)-methyltransferase
MPDRKKPIAEEKEQLHPRNKHRGRYNFPELIEGNPELSGFVSKNQYGDLSVDFKDPEAVKALNQALLKHFYHIDLWDIPEGFLCPPIPGRVDYLHYAADLLADPDGKIPQGKSVKVLDIGVGANCIYPLIGHSEYGWNFAGTDIDTHALRAAKNIVEANELSKVISIRKQDPGKILKDAIHPGEKFDLVICNPPFHSSSLEAAAGTERKWKNLGHTKKTGYDTNFGGKNGELWCEGGELKFITQMIAESAAFAGSVKWFTSLVSKKETLHNCYYELKQVNAAEVRTISMSQGQKTSRILAWRF